MVRLLSVLFLGWLLAVSLGAQKSGPQTERVGDGVLLHVLPPDQIPAIDDPEFVPASQGNKFMKDNEPVLGVFDGTVAKAYSLWQLDQHEIVNDSTPGNGPIAVTW